MSRRRRPTAFEVSFPEEAASFQEESTGTSDVDRKRCRDGPVLDDIRVRVFNPYLRAGIIVLCNREQNDGTLTEP